MALRRRHTPQDLANRTSPEELRAKEAALATAHQRYFKLFDFAPTSYIVFNKDHQIQELNLTACELLSIDRDQVDRRPFFLYVDQEQRDDFHRHLNAVFTERNRRSIDLLLHIPGGRSVHLQLQSQLIHDTIEEQPLCLTACFDVTERHKAEEERLELQNRFQETQRLESLGVLAGGVAHDFNNLLMGILGNASMARSELAANSRTLPFLQRIENAASRAADLCKQMLAYAGRSQLAFQTVDVSATIENTLQLLQLSVSKKASLRLNLARNLPSILADDTQIRQIVMNLVINASEALENHPGIIAITTGFKVFDADWLASARVGSDLPAREYVFLEVTDNGCGMDSQIRNHVFEPFFTTKFAGRGLGLSAVLGTVRSHQGALKVESKSGHGSTFTLLFPPTEATLPTPPPLVPTATSWRGSGKVLVVDDEEAVRAVLARMLESFGFEVVTASDGEAGLAQFKQMADDLVLVVLDLSMPELDGEEVLRRIHKLNPEFPILLISGFNEPVSLRNKQSGHVRGFIQKPFKPNDLREHVRALLAPKAG